MSKKIALALGGNALDDDLAGQAKAVKITSQTIVDLITQGHEVIVTRGNGSQVDMINQAFEVATETGMHSPVLPMSVCVVLSQGYVGYDLQNALREELLSHGINKPVVALVIQVEVDANDSAFLNSAKPIGSFFTEQGAELLTKQGYTLKEDASHDYRRVVASPKPIDIIEKEAVRALVDTRQMVTTVGDGGIPVICKGNHLRGVNTVIGKGQASARLAEMTDADTLVILTTVEKVAINLGKENEQQLDRLSLGDAKHSIGKGHFAKGSMLLRVETVASLAYSHAGREALITVLSKAKEGTRGKTGTVIRQQPKDRMGNTIRSFSFKPLPVLLLSL